MQNTCKERMDEIDNLIKAVMGTHETATGLHFCVKWGNTSRSIVDSKRLKAEQPNIYREFLKTSDSRRFEVKEIV